MRRRTSRFRLSVLFEGRALPLAVFLLFADATRAPATLLAVSRDNDKLRVVDPATGLPLSDKTLVLSPPGLIQGVWGLADDPLTPNALWVVIDQGDESHRRLGRIDLAGCSSTSCTVVDRGDLAGRFEGLAAACDGELYGITGQTGTLGSEDRTLFRGLHSCTAAACAPLFVTAMVQGDLGQAIAIHDFRLFHAVGQSDPQFESLDLATLDFFDIGRTGSWGQASAMAWDPVAGSFFLAGLDSLYRISLGGVVTPIGAAVGDQFSGLALVDAACPELFRDGFESGGTGRWSSTSSVRG